MSEERTIYFRATAYVVIELLTVCQTDAFLRIKLAFATREPGVRKQMINCLMMAEEAWHTAQMVHIAGVMLDREMDYCHRDNLGLPTRGHLAHGERQTLLTKGSPNWLGTSPKK